MKDLIKQGSIDDACLLSLSMDESFSFTADAGSHMNFDTEITFKHCPMVFHQNALTKKEAFTQPKAPIKPPMKPLSKPTKAPEAPTIHKP